MIVRKFSIASKMSTQTCTLCNHMTDGKWQSSLRVVPGGDDLLIQLAKQGNGCREGGRDKNGRSEVKERTEETPTARSVRMRGICSFKHSKCGMYAFLKIPHNAKMLVLTASFLFFQSMRVKMTWIEFKSFLLSSFLVQDAHYTLKEEEWVSVVSGVGTINVSF